MKKIQIFLASSSELKEDRREFELFISRENKEWHDKGLFFDLQIWEDFLDAMSKTRLQDEYNKAIRSSDVFVMLFFTKVGKYTHEEFMQAYQHFQQHDKPLIYTYFKNAPINTGNINKDMISLLEFREKLGELGHFYTVYNDINDLKYQFGQQLSKLADTYWVKEKETPNAPQNEEGLELLQQKIAELERQRLLEKQELEQRLAQLTAQQQTPIISPNVKIVAPTAPTDKKQEQPTSATNSFTDERDGNVYKTVQIGNQLWMAQNLAYKADIGCWAYDNNIENVKQYGYLYDWTTACKIAPQGWHLPTDEEWQQLEQTVGLAANDTQQIGWRGSHAITLKSAGSSGFNVVMGGYRNPHGSFGSARTSAFFWSSSSDDATNAWYRSFLTSANGLARKKYEKQHGFSVRLVRD